LLKLYSDFSKIDLGLANRPSELPEICRSLCYGFFRYVAGKGESVNVIFKFWQGAAFGTLAVLAAVAYLVGLYHGKLEAAETRVQYAGFRFVAQECVKVAQEQDFRIKATINGTKKALVTAP